MSLLEAISPTARMLLGKTGGGRMNICKPSSGPRALKIHVQLSRNKTLCGILFDPAQEDLAEANCKRCLRCQAHARIHRPRPIIRLNGRRVSVNQTTIKL
jgi:hypothetical protein